MRFSGASSTVVIPASRDLPGAAQKPAPPWVSNAAGSTNSRPSTLRKKCSALTIENTANDRSMRRYDLRSLRQTQIPMKFALGQSIQRLEDDTLLRGAGRYTDDFALANAAHVIFVRSPHAHARL